MDMSDIKKLMDEYFDTVTDGQFALDMIKAGISECPFKVNISLEGDPVVYSFADTVAIQVGAIIHQASVTQNIKVPDLIGQYKIELPDSKYFVKDVA